MKSSVSVFLVAASAIFAASLSPAAAAKLPPVKASGSNVVPACATPGRLMALIRERNDELDRRFSKVATAYMRHGERLGVRWDFAFFQMMLETGSLSFQKGNGKPGLVRASQNNFAGLGATGRGEHGEAFPDIDAGVKAHLQHLLMYAGEHIADPVAERTRKVQEWGILTSWQKRFRRPITFDNIAAKWAPGSRGYGSDIASIAEQFTDDFCGKADPKPEMVAEARGGSVLAAVSARRDVPDDKITGKDLARQAIERAKANGEGDIQALGASAAPLGGSVAAAAKVETNGIRILNGFSNVDKGAATKSNEGAAKVQTASAAGAAKAAGLQIKPSAGGKCRVWTASYGGAKSVIIRSIGGKQTNFTVLEVNEGQEARETEAYIAAYAKGGAKIADFGSQTAALNKAFQLCPEG